MPSEDMIMGMIMGMIIGMPISYVMMKGIKILKQKYVLRKMLKELAQNRQKN
ncbi:MAG: hypothetical protein ACPKPY_01930 [Nitrososphaeraceae archaeon]